LGTEVDLRRQGTNFAESLGINFYLISDKGLRLVQNAPPGVEIIAEFLAACNTVGRVHGLGDQARGGTPAGGDK
jgi:hypothetical protein